MALYKVQIIQDWPEPPRKSRMSNPSLGFPTFTVVSFMDILKSLSHLCTSPARVHPGTFPMSAVPPLKHLKWLSPQLQSLPIGSQIPKLQSRLMPPTMHSPLYPIAFHSQMFSAP